MNKNVAKWIALNKWKICYFPRSSGLKKSIEDHRPQASTVQTIFSEQVIPEDGADALGHPTKHGTKLFGNVMKWMFVILDPFHPNVLYPHRHIYDEQGSKQLLCVGHEAWWTGDASVPQHKSKPSCEEDSSLSPQSKVDLFTLWSTESHWIDW